MVRFSDTAAMTGRVIKLNPSVVFYPLMVLPLGVALRALGLHPSLSADKLPGFVSETLTNAGFVLAATAFTYAILRIGYFVAKQLDRPTVVTWNPWVAAFGLAIPWIIAITLFVMFGTMAMFCLVIPGLLFFGLQWPYLVLAFGPRFNLETSTKLAKGLRKESPFWLGSLGILITVIAFGAATLQTLELTRLGIDLPNASEASLIGLKALIDSVLAIVVYASCIYPIVAALMLAEDLHEPIYNAEYEAERRQKDMAELDHYFQDSVLPTLAVAPPEEPELEVEEKIQTLQKLRDAGAISEEIYQREIDRLQA